MGRKLKAIEIHVAGDSSTVSFDQKPLISDSTRYWSVLKCEAVSKLKSDFVPTVRVGRLGSRCLELKEQVTAPRFHLERERERESRCTVAAWCHLISDL